MPAPSFSLIPVGVQNLIKNAKNSTSFDLSIFLSKPQAWHIIAAQRAA
jgi:hypothetical protein